MSEILICFNILLASSAVFCLKYTTKFIRVNVEVPVDDEPNEKILILFLAFLLNTCSFTILALLLQKNEMGKAQVLISTGMLTASTLVGRFVFQEYMNAWKMASIALALMSAVIMHFADK